MSTIRIVPTLMMILLTVAAGVVAGEPLPDTLSTSPTQGAVVLFDGQGINLFVSQTGGSIDWPIEDGALVSTPNSRRSNNLVSRFLFGDAQIHVEFELPEGVEGNSGVFLQGEYELQILNSSGKRELAAGDIGAVYGLHRPLVNADRGPGEWQRLDVHFVAPRRNTSGEIVDDGTITAWLNGKQIQDHARVGTKTSDYNPYLYDSTPYLQAISQRQRQSMTGPLILQDHDCPVRFRNIWVKPLDGRATVDGSPVSPDGIQRKHGSEK